MRAHSAPARGISLERALLPRLNFARGLVGGVARDMRAEAAALSRANRRRAAWPAGRPWPGPVRREALARLSAAALAGARRRLEGLGSVGRVPGALAVAVPAVRGVSAALHGEYPGPSSRLCAAAAVLGGVLADSACIAGARFDFARSNAASAALLDEAKLTAYSKMGKLYPNLRGPPAWAA